MIEKLTNNTAPVQEQKASVPLRVYKNTGLRDLQRETEKIGDLQTVDFRQLMLLEVSARDSSNQLLKIKSGLSNKNLVAAESPEKQTSAIVEVLVAKTERLLDELMSLNEFLKILRDEDKEKKLSDKERESLTVAVESLKKNLIAKLSEISRLTFESPFNLSNLVKSAKRIIAPLLASAALVGLISSDESAEIKLGTRMVAGTQTSAERQTLKTNRSPHIKKGKIDAFSGNISHGVLEKPFKSTPGNIFRPNIESLGVAGEFPSGKPVAEISFSSKSQISDPLWITDTIVQAGNTFISANPEIITESKQTHATVKFKPFNVSAEETIALPYPLGYGVTNVRTEPPTVFSVDNNLRTIKFAESKDSLVISYDVIRVGESIAIPNQTSDAPSFIDQEHEKTLNLLKKASPNKIEGVLNEHLRNFTYITSSHLQSLIDAMPGAFEEKVALLKVGDCDQLSCYLSTLLSQAGKKSFVATGYLQNGDSIDAARPHAKLALLDERGASSLFETTAATRGRHINVAFNNLDFEHLSRLVEQLGQETDPLTIRGQMIAFRTELQTILSKSEYQKFDATNSFQDAIKDQLNILERLNEFINSLESQADTKPKEIIFCLGIVISEIALILSMVYAFIVSGKKTAKMVRCDFDKSVLELFNKMAGSSELKKNLVDQPTEKNALADEINLIYSEKPNIEKLMPKDTLLARKVETQRAFVKTIAVAQLFVADPWSGLGLLPAIVGRLRWNQIVESLAADGITVDKLFAGAKAVLTNPAVLEKMEKKIPEKVDAAIKEGLKMAVRHNKKGEEVDLAESEKEFLKRLALNTDEENKTNSRRPSKGKSIDFLDHIPYQPGMDTNLIDWNVYARTDQLFIKRFAEEKNRSQTVGKFDILIDAARANSLVSGLNLPKAHLRIFFLF